MSTCRTSLAFLLAGIGSVLILAGCTNADVFVAPGLGSGQQDDKLQVTGSFCTEHPDELNFPVKIMFIIDCSQSMNVTDPPPSPNDYPHRVQAVWDVIKRFRYEPGVSFAILRFESAANVATQRDTNGDGIPDQFGFVNDLPSLLRALLSLQSAGGNTSYQAAIALAEATLAMDMSTTAVDERGRTKYVVIFLSDGLPYPVDFQQEINTPFGIKRALNEMMGLPKRFQVADFKFHTAYLSVNTPQFVAAQAEQLLKDMAKIGGGTYRNFQNGEQINFLDIDYTSVKRMYSIKNGAFLVSNSNAHPLYASKEDAVDTDGDGLVDKVEEQLGTDIGNRDTDGDGFNDLLEDNLRRSGFDPLDPDDADCRLALDRLDRDGDGLLDCEERFIGTSPDLFDTDGDGVPDPVEVISGTNPVGADAVVDMDFDGTTNGTEVAWHTNPTFNDAANFSDIAYRYQVAMRAGTFESRKCYDFKVSNITLVGTKARKAGDPEGYNDVMVYIGQVPYDDPSDYGTWRVACARTRYIPAPPGSNQTPKKYPPSGIVKFQQKDFKRPTSTRCSSDAECPNQVCDPRDNLCLAPLGQKCDAKTPCPNFTCFTDPNTSKKSCIYPPMVACMVADDCPPYPTDPSSGLCSDPLHSMPDPTTKLCPKRECVPQYFSCSATVPCKSDTTDPNKMPVCLDGFCRVPCVDASGCNPGETCEADMDKDYPPCKLASDCPTSGMQCINGGCHSPCTIPTDCPGITDTCEDADAVLVCIGHHCVDHHGGQCAPLGCNQDTDCPLQLCDSEVGRCRVQPCLDSRECPHQVCEEVVGMCMSTACTDDQDCRGDRGFTCNDIVGDPCVRDIDCPFNFCSQEAHGCFYGNAPCTANSDCALIPNVCTGSKRCTGDFSGCANDTDCTGNNGGVCRPTCNLSNAPCVQDSDCSPNFCRSYYVCANNPAKTCTVSLDCGKPSFCVIDAVSGDHCINDASMACNPATENIDNVCQVGMCARQNSLGNCDTVGQEQCSTDADCPPYHCNIAGTPAVCLYPVHIACQTSADCPAPLTCNGQGFCEKTCTGDNDCPPAHCQGRCVPMDPNGRRRCTDWFVADRDCLRFGEVTPPAGP